jgi:hypothetical protein
VGDTGERQQSAVIQPAPERPVTLECALFAAQQRARLADLGQPVPTLEFHPTGAQGPPRPLLPGQNGNGQALASQQVVQEPQGTLWVGIGLVNALSAAPIVGLG